MRLEEIAYWRRARLRTLRLLGITAWLACGCTKTTPTAASVYQSLVEAGCLAATADGEKAVADEHALHTEPPWSACLWQGGTVQSCGVPCSK